VSAGAPLSDVRVLDLSRLLPGPYATLVLADLGARVDKVEDPQGGDYVRQMPPRLGDESAYFYALHRNKRSLTLDLKNPAGVAAIKRLVRRYDVLVESFRPGVMDKLGLSYAALAAENPALVYCSISGFGQTGPDRLRAGHDVNYLARAGVLGYGGPKAGAPAMLGGQMADICGGSVFAVVGILAALHERARTGQGRHLDISMTDGATSFVHMQLAARLLVGAEDAPLRRGGDPLNGGYAGYNVYRAKDGRYLAVGALEPKFLAGFLERLGRSDLLGDAYDLGGGADRARAELDALFATEPRAHWLALFEGADVCVEPVHEGGEALDDPQLRARGMFVPARDEQRGVDVTHLRTPLQMGPLPVRPPPELGQHSQEILAEAGFTPQEMGALQGVG
jgi:alpha-methylacyl-CoA racemase